MTSIYSNNSDKLTPPLPPESIQNEFGAGSEGKYIERKTFRPPLARVESVDRGSLSLRVEAMRGAGSERAFQKQACNGSRKVWKKHLQYVEFYLPYVKKQDKYTWGYMILSRERF